MRVSCVKTHFPCLPCFTNTSVDRSDSLKAVDNRVSRARLGASRRIAVHAHHRGRQAPFKRFALDIFIDSSLALFAHEIRIKRTSADCFFGDWATPRRWPAESFTVSAGRL